MHHVRFPKLISYDEMLVYIGVATVCYMAMLFALPPTWLVSSEERRMQFRAPQNYRLAMMLAMTVPIVMLSESVPDSPIASLVAICGLIFLGIYMAGPHDTLIDGKRWVYERTEGWPWRPKTRIGSLDDITGVFVTRQNSVALKYKYKDGWLRVDMPSGQGRAEAIAANIAQTTGLPLIACPLQIR